MGNYNEGQNVTDKGVVQGFRFGVFSLGVCGGAGAGGESFYDWGRCCRMISLD